MALDVYCYGMAVLSTIHRVVSGDFAADGYGEIGETHVCPGGEAMNAAILLSQLGLSVGLAGPDWGSETREALARYAMRYGIDVSGIREDPSYPGVRDLVIVSRAQRSVLGWFGSYFSEQPARWSEPDARAIECARAVALDPFFGASSARCAELCARAGTPYVTLDCEYDGALHGRAAATVISREYRQRAYPELNDSELLARYTDASPALTILTAGSEPIICGRGTARFTIEPFSVEVKSTLGAGDAFRAGVVLGLLAGLDDSATVHQAAALAALACTRLPIADAPPSRQELDALLRGHS